MPGPITERAVDAGLQLLRGETLAAQRILIKPELITRDNVNDYRGWNSLGESTLTPGPHGILPLAASIFSRMLFP